MWKKCSLRSKIHSRKLLFRVAPLYLSFRSRILAFTVNLNRKLDRFSLHCTETRVATRCATRNRSQLGEEEGFIFHSLRPLTPDILAHVLDDDNALLFESCDSLVRERISRKKCEAKHDVSRISHLCSRPHSSGGRTMRLINIFSWQSVVCAP